MVSRNDIDSAFKTILGPSEVCIFQITSPGVRDQLKILETSRTGAGITVRLDRYIKNALDTGMWKAIIARDPDRSDIVFRVRFMCITPKESSAKFRVAARAYAWSSEQIENLLKFEKDGNSIVEAVLSINWSIRRAQPISISANPSFANCMDSEPQMAQFLKTSSDVLLKELARIARLSGA